MSEKLESFISFSRLTLTRNNLRSALHGGVSEREISSFLRKIAEGRTSKGELAKNLSLFISESIAIEEAWNKAIEKEKSDLKREFYIKSRENWREEKIKYKQYGNRVFRWCISSFLVIFLYSSAVWITGPEEDRKFWKMPIKETVEKFAPKD